MTSSSLFGGVAFTFAVFSSALVSPAMGASLRELAWGTFLRARLITGVEVSSDEKFPVLVNVFDVNGGNEPCIAKGNASEIAEDGRIAIEMESISCADSMKRNNMQQISAFAREGQRIGVQGSWRKNEGAEKLSAILESLKSNAIKANAKRKEGERVPEEEMKRRFHELDAQVRSYVLYLEPGREFDLVISKELRVGRAEGSKMAAPALRGQE